MIFTNILCWFFLKYFLYAFYYEKNNLNLKMVIVEVKKLEVLILKYQQLTKRNDKITVTYSC